MADKLYQHQQGSTIIDSMIGAAVLGFSAMAVTGLQGNLIQGHIAGTQHKDGVMMAGAKLEDLKHFKNEAEYDSKIVSGTDSLTQQNTVYTRTWTVIQSATGSYKDINLTVSWTDNKNKAQQIQLSTTVARVEPALAGVTFSAKAVKPADFAGPEDITTETVIQKITSQFAQLFQSKTEATVESVAVQLDSDTAQLKTNQANGQILEIDGKPAITISGSIKVDPESLTWAKISDQTSAIAMITSNGGAEYSSYCNESVGDEVISFTCVVTNPWLGKLGPTGLDAKHRFCTNSPVLYEDITASVTGQDYVIIKEKDKCPSEYPNLF